MLDLGLFSNDEPSQRERAGEQGESGDAFEKRVQTEVTVRLIITVLCGVGLYASLFMLRKTRRAEQGLLVEPSVVQMPRARLLIGIPNAAFGAAYYVLLGICIWLPRSAALSATLTLASLLAVAMSAMLAYSLLRVTRMPCPYCWTSHAINALLLLCMVLVLFKVSY